MPAVLSWPRVPGPDDDVPADPDRAAILARRRRFVALALSTLSGATACPRPCLNVARPEDAQGSTPGAAAEGETDAAHDTDAAHTTDAQGDPSPDTDAAGGGGDAAPEPCLKVARRR